MKIGSPPTAPKARAGLLTPPGMSCLARSNAACSWVGPCCWLKSFSVTWDSENYCGYPQAVLASFDQLGDFTGLTSAYKVANIAEQVVAVSLLWAGTLPSGSSSRPRTHLSFPSIRAARSFTSLGERRFASSDRARPRTVNTNSIHAPGRPSSISAICVPTVEGRGRSRRAVRGGWHSTTRFI